jgi:DNA-binding MarR family transcriptional regulator
MMAQEQEYYTQEELQNYFGVTYYKMKEAMDRLTATGEIVVETKALDRRKKYVHRKYLPKFKEYFGL